jgi:hypothetical protein
MKQFYKNQTFSLPIEISIELHSLVKRREMSRFLADAIHKELRDAYISANTDSGQIETSDEWQGTF